MLCARVIHFGKFALLEIYEVTHLVIPRCQWIRNVDPLRYVYTLRLIERISYLGACYIRTTVTKCILEKMTLHFRR